MSSPAGNGRESAVPQRSLTTPDGREIGQVPAKVLPFIVTCHGPAGACVLPFGTHENHIFLDEWVNDPSLDFTFPEDGGRF